MKVALLQGGRSLERGVSLRSGARVTEALLELGHEVETMDLGPELVSRLGSFNPDVAFIALHGTEGEDGTVQALLELLGIPHTGPRVAACQRCMDKSLAKYIFRENGIATPDWVTYSEASIRDFGAASTFPRAIETVGLPLEEVEREHIRRTLEATGHNRAEAAKLLKIGERTLYRKIKEYKL
jgi:D-alanine-D-alanine ligase